jgi:hypothetical protein
MCPLVDTEALYLVVYMRAGSRQYRSRANYGEWEAGLQVEKAEYQDRFVWGSGLKEAEPGSPSAFSS